MPERSPPSQYTPALEAIAALYREGGRPAQVDGDAFTAPYSAPRAGAPPWRLFRLTAHTMFGVATAEPHGAPRWRFCGVEARRRAGHRDHLTERAAAA
jgi:hypothetical protein